MKTLTSLVVACFVLAVFTGCESIQKTGERNAATKAAYIAQQRDMKVIEAEFVEGIVGNGAGGTVTITGLKKLTLSNALTPLAEPAPEKNVVEAVVDGAVKVTPALATAYVGGKLVDKVGTSTSSTSKTTTTTTTGGQ